MKSMTFIKFWPILVLLMCFGCAEDIDKFIPDPQVMQKGDIDRFFDAARDDITQTSTINIDFPEPVVTSRKTVLVFERYSLIDPQGNVATGDVEISILELLTKGEILLYGIPTNSRGNVLYSGGEFYITATQNGVPLSLRPDMPVRILTDVATPDHRMELFYGIEENTDFGEVMTWDDADNNPVTWDNVIVTEWVVLADSQQIITGFGYECFSDSLQWINFDVFMDIPPEDLTDVCVTLPPEYGNVNTMVFLVFNDLNSVIALPGDPGTMQFCNFYTMFIKMGVPVGASVTFVVISEQGEGCYFFAIKETVLIQDHEENLVPVKTTLEEIKNIIMML